MVLIVGNLTINSQPVRNKNRENTRKKKNNHTHKIIFTWFGNLPTSTELQEFHYYQGKIQSVKIQFFRLSKKLKPRNPNHQKNGFSKNLLLKTTQHYFELDRQLDQI